MRCYICDVVIPDRKAKYHTETGELEPCHICLEIIFEALYGDNEDFSLDDASITLLYDNEKEEAYHE